jgi:membrane protease YdiL (CAAX protease family)
MEPLILYFVLFFPGVFASTGVGGAEAVPFSILRELGRTLTYTIPSLALLWYLIAGRKSQGKMSAIEEVIEGVVPQKRDIFPLIIGLPGLILAGLGISVLASLLSEHFGIAAPLKAAGPSTIPGFLVMILSCLGTGYLEESYFRYYLLLKLEIPVPNTAMRAALSTALFSLCHMYEGPWGILNAVIAGLLLSALFVRCRSLHGIALAHAFYNMFVYVVK